MAPPMDADTVTRGTAAGTLAAISAKRAWATKTFASQFSTMYCTSSRWRCQFTGVK
jgi:hypothetical protein